MVSCLLALDMATFTRGGKVTDYDNILLRYSQIFQKHHIVEDAFWKGPQLIVVEIPTQVQQNRGTVRRCTYQAYSVQLVRGPVVDF